MAERHEDQDDVTHPGPLPPGSYISSAAGFFLFLVRRLSRLGGALLLGGPSSSASSSMAFHGLLIECVCRMTRRGFSPASQAGGQRFPRSPAAALRDPLEAVPPRAVPPPRAAARGRRCAARWPPRARRGRGQLRAPARDYRAAGPRPAPPRQAPLPPPARPRCAGARLDVHQEADARPFAVAGERFRPARRLDRRRGRRCCACRRPGEHHGRLRFAIAGPLRGEDRRHFTQRRFGRSPRRPSSSVELGQREPALREPELVAQLPPQGERPLVRLRARRRRPRPPAGPGPGRTAPRRHSACCPAAPAISRPA